eukprot:gene36765-4539_t
MPFLINVSNSTRSPDDLTRPMDAAGDTYVFAADCTRVHYSEASRTIRRDVVLYTLRATRVSDTYAYASQNTHLLYASVRAKASVGGLLAAWGGALAGTGRELDGQFIDLRSVSIPQSVRALNITDAAERLFPMMHDQVVRPGRQQFHLTKHDSVHEPPLQPLEQPWWIRPLQKWIAAEQT